MTRSKILDRLLTFAPPLIERCQKMPNHCVYSTAVGVDVLRAFDIPAEPLSVRIIIANRIYLRAMAKHMAPVTAVAMGGHIMDTSDGTVVGNPKLWSGHLVVHLPDSREICDLNMGQFSRPKKQIELPPAAMFPFTAPFQVYPFNGLRIEYHDRPDPRWQDAPDLIPDRRRDIVRRLVQAIRCGRL